MKRSREEIDHLVASLAEGHGLGGINPSEDQYRELLADEREGLVQYINLLKFKPEAEYPAGHELADTGLSGADAYMRYGEIAVRKVEERGGRLPYLNQTEQIIIGRSPDWDQVAVMEYPDREAFIDMLQDPEYLASLVHRDAGLERTVVIISRPLFGG